MIRIKSQSKKINSILILFASTFLIKEVIDRIRVVDFPRIFGDEQGPINYAKIFAGYPSDVYTGYLPGMGIIYTLPYYIFDKFYLAFKASQLINLAFYILSIYFIYKVNVNYFNKLNSFLYSLFIASYLGITTRVAYLMTETAAFFILSSVMYLIFFKNSNKKNNLAIVLLSSFNIIHQRYIIAFILAALSVTILKIWIENIKFNTFIKAHKEKIFLFGAGLVITQGFNVYSGAKGKDFTDNFIEFFFEIEIFDYIFISLTIVTGLIITLISSFFYPFFALIKIKKNAKKLDKLHYVFFLLIFWIIFTSVLQSLTFTKYYFDQGIHYYESDNISTFIFQSRYFDPIIPILLSISIIIINKDFRSHVRLKNIFSLFMLVSVFSLTLVWLLVRISPDSINPSDHLSNPLLFVITDSSFYFSKLDRTLYLIIIFSFTIGFILYLSKGLNIIIYFLLCFQIMALQNYNSWDIGITNTPNFNNKIITSEVNRILTVKLGDVTEEELCVETKLPSSDWWFNSKYSIYFNFPMKYSDNPSAQRCILIVNKGELPEQGNLLVIDDWNNHFLYERKGK